MDQAAAKVILDSIVGQVFGYQNPLTLDEAMMKFAFDVRLPQQVYDAKTSKPTWVAALSQNQFLTPQTVQAEFAQNGGIKPPREMKTLEDVVAAWGDINYSMSERQINSTNVCESDGVYNSQNVYRSIDVRKSHDVLFSDGVDASEFIVAGQTSRSSKYCIRLEDSKHCENSFNVNWSSKITNSMFIQDCFDLSDCMFCTHLASKQFCIANIQLEEAEYRELKTKIVQWVLRD